MVATGGDDNALSLTNIQVYLSHDLKMTSFKMVDIKTEIGAHVSSITGDFIICRICTAAITPEIFAK